MRLGFLGAADKPVLAQRAMSLLEGKVFSSEVVAAVQKSLAEDLDPPKDLTTSSAAKLHLARVLTGRALAALSQ